jgi:tetratricopeptide (TPR) repeat protein
MDEAGMSPDPEDKPAASPLDAEREALRKAGYTDAEVSQILIARASAASQQPAGAPGQGVMSNALSSIVAVASHARGLIPTFRKDVETVFDGAAAASARAGATASLAVKAVVILVLGYAAFQEWQIHIVAAPQQATATAQKVSAEAAVAKDVAAGEQAKAHAQTQLVDRRHPDVLRWIPEVEPRGQNDYDTCGRETEPLQLRINFCTRVLQEGTAKNPTTREFVYIRRGNAYMQNHQPELAIEDFTRAIKLDPYNSDLYRWRGLAKAKANVPIADMLRDFAEADRLKAQGD